MAMESINGSLSTIKVVIGRKRMMFLAGLLRRGLIARDKLELFYQWNICTTVLIKSGETTCLYIVLFPNFSILEIWVHPKCNILHNNANEADVRSWAVYRKGRAGSVGIRQAAYLRTLCLLDLTFHCHYEYCVLYICSSIVNYFSSRAGSVCLWNN